MPRKLETQNTEMRTCCMWYFEYQLEEDVGEGRVGSHGQLGMVWEAWRRQERSCL